MESAYVLMFSTFGLAVVLGAITSRNWISVGIPLLVPLVFTIARVGIGKPGPGTWEALLFVSPFLVAGAILYSGIALVGAKLGRRIRKGLAGEAGQEKNAG
jgi:hypothetical protein